MEIIFHSALFINEYSIVALNSSFYIFGGYKSKISFYGMTRGIYSSVIASFSTTTKRWEKLGYLNEARTVHGVIVHQGEFIIVGGYNENIRYLSTERCILSDDLVQCSTAGPKLQGYSYYPEMMLVSENFCSSHSQTEKTTTSV